MPGINIVSSVFSLADRTLEKTTLDSGKLDLGLVSAGSNGIERRSVFVQRSPVVHRTAKKVVFC